MAPYTDFSPSRVWIYYYARLLEVPDQTMFDEGCQIRNAIKSFKKYGVCEESVFPYPEDLKSVSTKQTMNGEDREILPTKHPARVGAPDTAKANSLTFFDFQFEYYRIRSLFDDPGSTKVLDGIAQVRWSISEGFPVIFGFSSYKGLKITDSKNWTNNQYIEFASGHREIVGGHAVLAVGFDEKRKAFQVQNLWDTIFGDKGFGWVPYSWLGRPTAPVTDR